VAVAVVAIIGIVGTLLGVLIGGRIQERGAAQRLRAELETAHRRAQFERLRELYARMATGAQSLLFILREQPYIVEGETKEERDKRHDQIIRETQVEVAEVGGLILIDPAVTEVRAAYAALWQFTDAALRDWRHPTTGVPIDVSKTVAAKELADSISALAEDHLAELDTPATVPEPAPWWQFWK
jgi:hypothetical protein